MYVGNAILRTVCADPPEFLRIVSVFSEVETEIKQPGSGPKHGFLRGLDCDTKGWREVAVVGQIGLCDIPASKAHVHILRRAPIRLNERIEIVLMRVEQRDWRAAKNVNVGFGGRY